MRNAHPGYRRCLLWAAAAAVMLLPACNNNDGTGSQWLSAETVSSAGASSPRLTAYANGDLMAVWQGVATEERPATGTDTAIYARSDIWARRYDAATQAWGTAVTLQTGDWVRTVRIDRDANGVETSREVVGAPAETRPRLVGDGAGNALAAWQQLTQVTVDAATGMTRPVTQVWASRYDAASASWQTAARLDQALATHAGAGVAVGDPVAAKEPDLGIDSSGNIIAVWLQWNDADSNGDGNYDNVFNVYTARYSGGAWGTPEILSERHLPAADVRLAMNANSGVHRNAMAAWRQWDTPAGQYHIYARRYAYGGQLWETAVEVSDGLRQLEAGESNDPFTTLPPNGGAEAPAVAIDETGDAIVAWLQWDSTGSTTAAPKHNRHVYINRYNAGGGWSGKRRVSDTTVATDRVVTAAQPSIAVDAAGNAIVAWHQATQTFTVIPVDSNQDGTPESYRSENNSGDSSAAAIWAVRFDGVATQWASAGVLAATAPLDAVEPRVTTLGENTFLLAWRGRGSPLEHSVYNAYSRLYSIAADGNGAWGERMRASDGVGSASDLALTAHASQAWAAWQRRAANATTIEINHFQP